MTSPGGRRGYLPFGRALAGTPGPDGEVAAVLDQLCLTFTARALVGGRAVATWGLANGRVTVGPLEPIASEDLAELRADADRVLAYLGLPPAPAVVTT